MAGILVHALHRGGRFHPNALGAVAEGARVAELLGTECHALVVGSRAVLPDALCASLGSYGARRVHRAEGPEGLAQPAVDAMAAAIAAGGHDHALLGGGVLGLEVGAGLAARLDAGICVEAVALHPEDGRIVAERSIFGDSLRSSVRFRSPVGVVVGRVDAFGAPAAPEGPPAAVEDLRVDYAAHSRGTELLARGERGDGEPDGIEAADVLVGGGRGLGRAEGFAQLEALARALGGTVAATRAVVDAGWAPSSAQVGQTGKTVAPRLYVAAGISGAVQHKAGMQHAQHVVAINRDRAAPIFEWADLGIVGDLDEIIPRLTEAVRARREEGS